MAIQVRRGLKKDFDPYKMLPGEWAVSIDAQTQNQIVWMCFAAGVVKRMGTYEDFYEQINEIMGDKANQYIIQMAEAAKELQNNTEKYIQGKVDGDWLPALQSLVDKAAASEKAAASSSSAAKSSETASKASEQAASNSANTATQKAEEASQSAAMAAQEAQTATEKAGESDYWAKMSESHNHGNTGVRLGEDRDNSKYWSEWSKLHKDIAEEAADSAQEALGEVNKKLGLAEFSVDDDGNLIYTDNSGYNFVVGDDGNLYWEVA